MWWLFPDPPPVDAAMDVSDPMVAEAFGPVDETLVVGDQQVAVSAIDCYRFEEVVEREAGGMIVSAAIFVGIAVVFLIGVMSFGWRENFLIACVLLALFGAVSFSELTGIRSVSYLRLVIYTHEGDEIVFTCADPSHISELADVLDVRGISRV